MKKDIFADWLKELCMLVFIQTVQAFIFAIVMSLILSLLMGDYGSSNDATGSVGIIAVILLASISKIEELIKKVLGVKSNVHDAGMRGGMKSLATTMLAANLAKNVLDNGRKFVGGAAGAIGAKAGQRRDMNQARARMARDVARYGGNPALSTGGTNTAGEAGAQIPTATTSAIGAGSQSNSANASVQAAASGSNNQASEKLQDKIDAYNDRIAEIKAKRGSDFRKSLVNMGSGLVETAGAIGFGAVGMTAGAALGEGKEIIQGGLVGMGVGDKVGSIAMAPVRGINTIQDSISQTKAINNELIKQVNAINEQGTRVRNVREAKKRLDEQLSQLDISDI